MILVVLAVVTFVKLPRHPQPAELRRRTACSSPTGVLVAAGPAKQLPPNGKSLNICVNGQQYVWRYTYAERLQQRAARLGVLLRGDGRARSDTTVTLDINAQDVAHSWWIPKLGGKFDAIPGYTNHTWFKIPGKLAGTIFTGQCAELCGRNHANMIAQVRAVTPPRLRGLARPPASAAIRRGRPGRRAPARAQSTAGQAPGG